MVSQKTKIKMQQLYYFVKATDRSLFESFIDAL
jgi:hypothetical protein